MHLLMHVVGGCAGDGGVHVACEGNERCCCVVVAAVSEWKRRRTTGHAGGCDATLCMVRRMFGRGREGI